MRRDDSWNSSSIVLGGYTKSQTGNRGNHTSRWLLNSSHLCDGNMPFGSRTLCKAAWLVAIKIPSVVTAIWRICSEASYVVFLSGAVGSQPKDRTRKRKTLPFGRFRSIRRHEASIEEKENRKGGIYLCDAGRVCCSIVGIYQKLCWKSRRSFGNRCRIRQWRYYLLQNNDLSTAIPECLQECNLL